MVNYYLELESVDNIQEGLMITITDEEFMQLAQYIKNSYGIHLKKEEKTFMTGRLHNVLIESNCRSFTAYFVGM